MIIPEADYEPMKAFFLAMEDAVLGPSIAHCPPEIWPSAMLARTEADSPSNARLGLAMAVGDIIEMTEHFLPEQVAAIDARLVSEGIPTLTAVRARFWTRIRRILRNGVIKSERDFYAMRNVVDGLTEEEQVKAWKLLDSFEHRPVSKKK